MSFAERLPCGVPVGDLLAQVADGADPADRRHQKGCVYCRAALTEIGALWAPVGELAGQHVTAPSGLRASVMAKVRRLPRNAWHAVLRDDRGNTHIAARVVATVARMAAQGPPAVALAVRRGRPDAPAASGSPGPDVQVGTAGAHVVLDVGVVVRFGEHIPGVARVLRGRIRGEVESLLGVRCGDIDITVLDVQPPVSS